MYFDFEDYRPDTPRIERAISRREGVVYSVLAHILALLALVYGPNIPLVREALNRAHEAQVARQLALEQEQRERERAQFVFVQPRLDLPAPAPPPRAELSDQDRQARTVERPPDPTNPLPYARGNSSNRVEAQEEARARGQGPGPEPAPAEQPSNGHGTGQPAPALEARGPGYTGPDSADAAARPPGGSLGEALKNLQRYVQRESFENPQGGGGAFGPSIQFDTKGVEFGPWIRRFIAQIKRNWFIPYAAMSFRGHTVITFNVHKDGRLTDVSVIQPSSIDAFNTAAFNALLASNPTQELPPEYPADKAFFTVTFYYNEHPPTQD